MALLTTRRTRRGPHVLQALLALAVAALILAPAPLRAGVTAEGDVFPNVPDPDPGDPPIPALPVNGGIVPGGIVIVGGTGTPGVVAPIGRVIVDVPGSTLPVVSDNLFIAGEPGEGGVTGGGGDPTISGRSIGLVTISGFFSQWIVNDQLTVGGFGQAYLEITGGGQMTTGDPLVATSNEDAFVGQNEGSQGYVIISGFGSRMSNDVLTVGYQGKGRVEVTTRARLESRRTAFVGYDVEQENGNTFVGAGTVVIDGNGSAWHIGDGDLDSDTQPPPEDLILGRQGRGTVEVRNQGLIRVENDIRMGLFANSYGEIIVNGRDSLVWAFNNLTVAENLLSTAEMHVENEGAVRADVSMTIGQTAIVDLATGGKLIAGAPLPAPSVTPLTNNGVIRGDGRIEAGTTAFPIINNGDIRNAAGVANLRERLVITGPLTNNDNIESVGGEIEFQGLVTNITPNSEIVGIDAILRFRGGFNNVGGRLLLDNTLVETLGAPAPIVSNSEMSVSANSRASTIEGNLVLGGANVLGMQLGALNFSKLQVSGSATLAGVLDISGVSGYLPQNGDAFEIITAENVIPGFTTVTDNISGFDFTVVYEPDRVLLNAIGGFVFDADFDNNMFVDFGDFLTWQRNFGAMGVPAGTLGDADGDGDVDNDDLDVWEDQLGTPGPAVPIVGAVPEPSAALLALTALVLPLCRKRR